MPARKLSLVITLGLLGLAACAPDPADPESRADRGPIAKADLAGSCESSSCDGASPDGNCYCDSACDSFGDCCADKHEVCDPSECGFGDASICPEEFACALEGKSGEIASALIGAGTFVIDLELGCGLPTAICCDEAGNPDPACGGRLTVEIPPESAASPEIATSPHHLMMTVPAKVTTVEPITISNNQVGAVCTMTLQTGATGRVQFTSALRREPTSPNLFLEKNRVVVQGLENPAEGDPWGDDEQLVCMLLGSMALIDLQAAIEQSLLAAIGDPPADLVACVPAP
jgi:hypothetical protein